MRQTLVFLLAGLALTGCAGSLESTLRDAHEARTAPPDLRVVYDDHTPLAGGDRIEVDPGGAFRWWRLRPSFVEATSTPESLLGATAISVPPNEPPTFELQLTPLAQLALVELLLAIEPWEQDDAADPTRLDQRRAILHAKVAAGEETAWEWHGELDATDARLARIRSWAEVVVGGSTSPPAADLGSEHRPESRDDAESVALDALPSSP